MLSVSFFLVFSLIRWLWAFMCELMCARLFQCVYISTILCLLFGFAAVHICIYHSLYVYTHTNALHHVFALPLRICLSCALLTSCVANVQFGFLTHASRRVLIHTSAIFILPQLSDNDTLNTHEYSLTVCMSSFWILVGWHWCN